MTGSSSLFQKIFILFIAYNKFPKSLGYRRTDFFPFLTIKQNSFEILTIIKISNRGLNSKGKVNPQMLKEHSSRSLLLLLIDNKGTAMKPKIGVDLFNNFG